MALMTVERLERESSISRHTWRRWIAEGRVAAIRLGRRVRVDEVDYQKFLQAGRTIGRAAPDHGVAAGPDAA